MNKNSLSKYIDDTVSVLLKSKELDDKVNLAIELIINSIENNKKIIWCGNGGSAADAMHFSAELLGRFKKDRSPMNSISLTCDISAITAIGNDYGYENIFSRQIEGVGEKGDVLIAISTSGFSENIVRAIDVAKTKSIKVIGITGSKENNPIQGNSDIKLVIDSMETNIIQEVYQVVCSYICGEVESYFYPE
tara:strand:- start:7292 stop:7867 length:576 start_codon:yes stop_codon:yes gene_type:complete